MKAHKYDGLKLGKRKQIAAINRALLGSQVLHVVQISGGKDSQAVAKLVRSQYPKDEIIGLFCDTKFEHDITYAHVLTICEMYNLTLVVLNAGSVEQLIEKYGRYPSDRARFCTDELKIKPAKQWLVNKATEGYSIVNYIGVRADESPARTVRYGSMSDNLMQPHEFMPSKYPKYMGQSLKIRYCIPIVEWSQGDVFAYLGGSHNPLYDQGFDSVGCFPCMAGGDKWKLKAFNHDHIGQSHYEKMKKLEDHVIMSGHYPIFNSKIGKAGECAKKSQNGCAYCSM